MEWLNLFGLTFMAAIMVPNIIFAIRCKDGFENKFSCKWLEILEQIGRYGCFATMVINIPGTWFGWGSDEAFALYLIGNCLLIAVYLAVWVICWKKNNLFRALALSVIPAAVFLLSGILSRSVLLTLSAAVFAPAHISISCKNASTP